MQLKCNSAEASGQFDFRGKMVKWTHAGERQVPPARLGLPGEEGARRQAVVVEQAGDHHHHHHHDHHNHQDLDELQLGCSHTKTQAQIRKQNKMFRI